MSAIRPIADMVHVVFNVGLRGQSGRDEFLTAHPWTG